MNGVIVTVVVVLGIIVAGGFLLYFLGDLLMSISGKKRDIDAVREKQLKEQKELEARVNALENSQEARKDPQIATVLYNGGMVEEYNPSENEEEPAEEPAPEPEPQEEEEPEEEEDDDATSEYIRQRRAELLQRLSSIQQEREEEEEPEEEDVVNLEEEEEEEPAEEPEPEPVPEPTPEPEPVKEEPKEEEPEPVVVNIPTEEELAAEDKKVEKQVAETITVQLVSEGANSLAANFTLEELEARLLVEQDKLKENEKELRKNKKEFIPLRKVKNTLENDEKKLRRKEALVAKQKVVLYGVNNYADIDEEKAQKLQEDLDLLQGLKFSVQHCQEVMDKNADRYPLLETIYNLLNSQNAQIKQDIKSIEEAIEILKKRADEE